MLYRWVPTVEAESFRSSVMRPDSFQRFQPAHAGHREIHDEDVRRQLVVPLTGALAGVGFPNHRYLGMGLQQQPESGANHGMVVYEEDPDHVVTAVGAFTVTSGISA